MRVHAKFYRQSLTVFAYHCRLYYEDWAFLLDTEKSAMLPNMAAGM